MDPQDAVTEPGEKSQGKDPLVGKTLAGRFEIEALINRGGMGKIYRAKQMPLGRAVALKVLDIHDDGSEFRDRFFLEASLCAKLAHPNTIRIYDYGATDDGIYFIAMEYIAGESLQQLLHRVGSMTPARSVAVALQIAGALAEAHDAGIVHRDLKPGNVMVTAHGDTEFVKVLDFGLVKELGKESELSRTGTVLGSPLYIAPEQVHGTEVDGRADIYTLGLILYAMLMGKTAFEKGNPLHVLMQQTQKRPPPFAEANPEARVPGSLEWVVMTCLEKKPKDRFASMHELIRALKACTKELRGEVDSLRLELKQGAVVLPQGVDVSEVALPALTTSGSTTRLHRTQEAPPGPVPESPSQSTLMSTRPIRTVAMVVGGGSVFGGIVLAGIGAVLLLVIVGILLTRDEPAAPPPPEPVVVAPPPRPEPVPVPLPVAPQKIEVTLLSDPEGASVQRDGVLLGSTPLLVRLAEGEEMTVEVLASGYESETIVLSADVPSPSVTLSKKRSRPSPTPRPEPAPAPAPEPVPQPKPEPQPAPQPAVGGDMKPF